MKPSIEPLDSVDLSTVTGGNFESYAMIFLRALADTIGVASGRGYDPNYGYANYGYNNYAYNDYGYANNGYPYQDPRYAGYANQYGYRQGYSYPRGQMQMQMEA
jgi:hypothetical protein